MNITEEKLKALIEDLLENAGSATSDEDPEFDLYEYGSRDAYYIGATDGGISYARMLLKMYFTEEKSESVKDTCSSEFEKGKEVLKGTVWGESLDW